MEEGTLQTTLTVASRVGSRRLQPLSAKFAATDGMIDELSVAGLTLHWHAQRGAGDVLAEQVSERRQEKAENQPTPR